MIRDKHLLTHLESWENQKHPNVSYIEKKNLKDTKYQRKHTKSYQAEKQKTWYMEAKKKKNIVIDITLTTHKSKQMRDMQSIVLKCST